MAYAERFACCGRTTPFQTSCARTLLELTAVPLPPFSLTQSATGTLGPSQATHLAREAWHRRACGQSLATWDALGHLLFYVGEDAPLLSRMPCTFRYPTNVCVKQQALISCGECSSTDFHMEMVLSCATSCSSQSAMSKAI